MADVLDSRVLDDLKASVGGDDAFFAELVDELLDDAPRQLETLREATAAGDAERARRAAHTLKGNARTFGAATFAELCATAESGAASGDLDAVGAGLDAMDTAWVEVRAALESARGAG